MLFRAICLILITTINGSSLVSAGELAPAEMKYPNVVMPAFQFGTFGTAPGSFNNMQSLSVSDAGTLIISDTYNHRVQELRVDGTHLHSWNFDSGFPGGSIIPLGAHLLDKNKLIVLDARTDDVLLVNRSGELIRRMSNFSQLSLKSPNSMRLKGQRLYFADSGNDRIVVTNLEGTIQVAFGRFGAKDGEFRKPTDVAVDEEGNIYVADSDNNRIQKFDANGRFLSKWGEWGSYSGMMASPIGLYYHRNALYVADLVNHRIQVFDQSGKFKFQFGRHPPQSHEGNGRIHYPTSVAVTADGKYTVVCEPFEHRCQSFDEFKLASVKPVDDDAWWDKATKFHYGTGAMPTANFMTITEPDTHATLLFDIREDVPRFITTIGSKGSNPGEFIRPSGSFVDEELGLVYISDSGNRRIQAFNISQRDALSLQSRTDGISFSFSLNLADLALQSQMTKLANEAGANRGLSEPSGMRVGPDGNLWVMDPPNARMLVFNRKTFELIKIWGKKGKAPGELNNPLKFAFSKNGKHVFVADHYNYRVQAFDLDGKYQFHFGSEDSDTGKLFVLPFGIAAGVDGYVYVTDVGLHQVLKFDEQGKLVDKWGDWGSEPGQFYKPKGIGQHDDGRIFVIDFGNHRAQIFNSDGVFRDEFGINEAMQPRANRR